MVAAQKVIEFIRNPDYRFLVLAGHGCYHSMPDEEYLKRRFHARMGYSLDLSHPQTYNEKLQWLKLYDRKPNYTKMVDKLEAKEYVSSIIGEEYIIPTLGVWDRFEDIDFDSLPNQFVLKCTHDSGGIVICRDKRVLNKAAAARKIKKSLRNSFYWIGREWPYKDVKPRIIAEKYMEDDETSELRDYKFFTFNGKAKALYIATDRQLEGVETKFDFFDMDYHHLPFTNGHPNAPKLPDKPKKFDEMRKLAELLGSGMPQLRVDFYEANGRVFFGELTFFHMSGLVPFNPNEWDKTFGAWIELPEKS